MADTSAVEVEPLYRFQRHLFEDVLENGGSLLTPGKVVWTRQNFDELQQLFVEQPDVTPGRSFLDKLHLQLAEGRQTSKQLIAELLIEHFLIIWVGAISAASKLRTIETVLSWMIDPPPIPEDVQAVLALGPVHPGQWVLTRRDIQLSWLIQFGRLWLDQPAAERARLRNDAWAFRTFTDPLTEAPNESQRLAVLHLTFPTTFEAIVAADHKREIVARFSSVPGNEADVDRRLLELRAALQTGDEHLDWYSDPLRLRWSKTPSKWNPLVNWARKVHETASLRQEERPYKLALAQRMAAVRDALLSGSPDWTEQLRTVMTDKANNLTRWQDHVPLCEWVDSNPTEAREAFTALWDGNGAPIKGLAVFLDRMPSEAIGAAVGVRVNIGSFLLMARDPAALPPVKITPLRDAWKLAGWGPDKDVPPVQVYERALVLFEELVRSSARWPAPLADLLDAQGVLWVITNLTDKPQSWTAAEWEELRRYRGEEVVPPTPELPTTGTAEGPDHAVIDHLAEAAAELLVDREFLDEMVLLLEDKKQIVLYGPPGTGKTYLARRFAQALTAGQEGRVRLVQFHPAMSYEDFIEGLRPRVLPNGQVTYEVTPGPLMLAAEAARAEPGIHVLVVDEINRANLAKVLGELLFLLEYRDEAAQLMYRPKEAFTLPDNLLIVATMNTADRSVALVDAAMRRRFHFVPFFPHDGAMRGLLDRWLRAMGGRISIARFLDAVNVELREQVGEHLLIGPSHFMKTDLSDPALRRIWTYNVFPLIEEQLWGQRVEVDRWRWEAVRERFATELATADAAAPDVDV